MKVLIEKYVNLTALPSGGQIKPVIIVRTKGTVALRALALARFVACSQTVPTEHVEALGQDGVLSFDFARRAR